MSLWSRIRWMNVAGAIAAVAALLTVIAWPRLAAPPPAIPDGTPVPVEAAPPLTAPPGGAPPAPVTSPEAGAVGEDSEPAPTEGRAREREAAGGARRGSRKAARDPAAGDMERGDRRHGSRRAPRARRHAGRRRIRSSRYGTEAPQDRAAGRPRRAVPVPTRTTRPAPASAVPRPAEPARATAPPPGEFGFER